MSTLESIEKAIDKARVLKDSKTEKAAREVFKKERKKLSPDQELTGQREKRVTERIVKALDEKGVSTKGYSRGVRGQRDTIRKLANEETAPGMKPEKERIDTSPTPGTGSISLTQNDSGVSLKTEEPLAPGTNVASLNTKPGSAKPTLQPLPKIGKN